MKNDTEKNQENEGERQMETNLKKKTNNPNLVNKKAAMLDKIYAFLMYTKFSRLGTNLEGDTKNLIKIKRKKMGRGTGDRALSLETLKTKAPKNLSSMNSTSKII